MLVFPAWLMMPHASPCRAPSLCCMGASTPSTWHGAAERRLLPPESAEAMPLPRLGGLCLPWMGLNDDATLWWRAGACLAHPPAVQRLNATRRRQSAMPLRAGVVWSRTVAAR